MTHREHRLRQRIDELLDEREHLRSALTDARRRTANVSRLRKSRDLWRQRALRRRTA